jgi:hypothetical protein
MFIKDFLSVETVDIYLVGTKKGPLFNEIDEKPIGFFE